MTRSNLITRLADVPFASGTLSNLVPAQSITLFILPTAKKFHLRIGTNTPPGQMAIWLEGQSGQRYIFQSSSNLTTWLAFSTNTLASNSVGLLVAATNGSRMFYRGVLNSP